MSQERLYVNAFMLTYIQDKTDHDTKRNNRKSIR